MKEISLRFGGSRHLAGTITMPARSTGLGLLLPSAGFLHRIGPHRLHVRLAREAAARDVGSIRFDMPGIGDSLAAPNLGAYEVQALEAAQEAMELLATRTGASRFIVAGLCSGADVGYQVASEDDRVVALYMMEPPRLVSGPLSSALRVIRQVHEYGPGLAAKRILQLMAGGSLLGPRSGSIGDRAVPAPAEYTAGLRRLTDRGVHICMVYASSTMGGYDLWRLRRQYLAPLGLSTTLKVHVLPRTDHLFTRSEAKQALVRHLLQMMETVLGIAVDNRANHDLAGESSDHCRRTYSPAISQSPRETNFSGAKPGFDRVDWIVGDRTSVSRTTSYRPDIHQIAGRTRAVADSVSSAAEDGADSGTSSKPCVPEDAVPRER